MMSNFLVIIGGPPASGKTTIAQKLSDDFQIPLISKDKIKELLFDALGWSDREWSRKCGATAYKLMDQMVELELQAGRSVILESDFKPEFDNKKFQQWQKRFNIRYFQIFCHARAELLLNRFKERLDLGTRHPGHVDESNYKIFEQKHFNETFAPLEIKGELIKVDTNEPFEKHYLPIKEQFTLFTSGSL